MSCPDSDVSAIVTHAHPPHLHQLPSTPHENTMLAQKNGYREDLALVVESNFADVIRSKYKMLRVNNDYVFLAPLVSSPIYGGKSFRLNWLGDTSFGIIKTSEASSPQQFSLFLALWLFFSPIFLIFVSFIILSCCDCSFCRCCCCVYFHLSPPSTCPCR